MRHKLIWLLVSLVILVGGITALKLTVPFAYAEASLRSPALEFVVELQKMSDVDPEECAERYLYYDTDYQSEIPARIEITTKQLPESRVRVSIYDPSCRDDSVHSSIDRIYLHRTDQGVWIPYRHEWSQTGRGQFGWKTEPTS